MSNMDTSAYIVIGINQYHEDGFEVVKAFTHEDHAERYCEEGKPGEDAKYGWERYYVKEVDLVEDYV